VLVAVWFTVTKVPRVVCNYIDYFSNLDRDELSPTDTILREYHHQILHAAADVKTRNSVEVTSLLRTIKRSDRFKKMIVFLKHNRNSTRKRQTLFLQIAVLRLFIFCGLSLQSIKHELIDSLITVRHFKTLESRKLELIRCLYTYRKTR